MLMKGNVVETLETREEGPRPYFREGGVAPAIRIFTWGLYRELVFVA